MIGAQNFTSETPLKKLNFTHGTDFRLTLLTEFVLMHPVHIAGACFRLYDLIKKT